jgi:hypothetical protein
MVISALKIWYTYNCDGITVITSEGHGSSSTWKPKKAVVKYNWRRHTFVERSCIQHRVWLTCAVKVSDVSSSVRHARANKIIFVPLIMLIGVNWEWGKGEEGTPPPAIFLPKNFFFWLLSWRGAKKFGQTDGKGCMYVCMYVCMLRTG